MPPKRARRAFNKAILNESESDDETREDNEQQDDDDDDGDDGEASTNQSRGLDSSQSGASDNLSAVYPQPGQRPPGPGKLPPKVAKLDYRGKMRYFNPQGERHWVLRDMGHSGVVDGRIIWTFGDTLMGRPKNYYPVSNCSTAVGSMKRPMTATNTALGPAGKNCRQWIKATQWEKDNGDLPRWGLGGTNVVEYAPGKGLVYYLRVDRRKEQPKVKPQSGVAYVHWGPNDVPISKRANDGEPLWKHPEPKYGDVGVAYNAEDKKVYVYGHGPNGDQGLSGRCFLCRAPAEQAADIDAYEYWNGKRGVWTKKHFTLTGEGDTIKLEEKHAVFGWRVMNQAYPFWSNYYNCWMIIHGDCWGYSPILLRTAQKLEGPWQDHGVIAQTVPKQGGGFGGFRYAQTGHPEFDPTGKTVLATWTRSNSIWGVVITWE